MKAVISKWSAFRADLMQVPAFQRRYSWKRENWIRLWQELGYRYFERATAGKSVESSPIFLGALVRQEKPAQRIGDTDFSDYSIIDGQQRLITLSIMAAAIRDRYLQFGSGPWEQWNSDFLVVRDNETVRERIDVQREDRYDFQSIVLRSSDENKNFIGTPTSRVIEAYRFFFQLFGLPVDRLFDSLARGEDDELPEYVSSEDLGGGLDYKEFKNILLGVQFVDITLEERESFASEIFESLNSTGLELSAVDLMRNGFYLLLARGNDAQFSKLWLPLEAKHRKIKSKRGQLDLPTLNEFFSDEAIRRFGWVPQDRVYSKLIGEVKAKAARSLEPSSGSAARSVAVSQTTIASLEELTRIDRLYRFLLGSPSEPEVAGKYSVKVNRSVKFLAQWDAKPVRPLILQLLYAGERGAISQADLENSLRLLESFLVRRCVAGIGAQLIRSTISRIVPQLSESLTFRKVEEIFDRLPPIEFPTRAYLQRQWQIPLYDRTSRKRHLALIFWALELELSPETRETWPTLKCGTGPSSWGIEHIMPQGTRVGKKQEARLSRDWETELRRTGVTELTQFHSENKHVIGNLTLALNRDNSSYGELPFAAKREKYKTITRLRITTDSVLTEHQWGAEEIKKRSKFLIDLICKRWPYAQDRT